jgi:hypothetical protein
MEENQRKESTGQDEHPEDLRWVLVQEAVCKLGFSQREAAQRYSLPYETVKKRCQREEWPIPAKVQAAVPILSRNREIALKEAESWLEKGENHRQEAFRLASEAVKRAGKAPPEINDWADLERADKMARRAAGLEQDVATQSNAFTFNLVKELVGVADAVEIGAEILPE